MAIITDKVFFKGTPAQFCAVMQEYKLDSEAAGRIIDCEIIEPSEEVILPVSRPLSANADSLLARLSQSSTIREKRVVLQPESPRAVIRFLHIGHFYWGVSALLCLENRTQITMRVDEDFWGMIKEVWDSAVGYMDNLGYLEGGESVTQTKLVEPEGWAKKLEGMGISVHSDKWWTIFEEWVRAYWERKGRRALPISGNSRLTLEKIAMCSAKTIYQKTSLGDKGVTLGNTR